MKLIKNQAKLKQHLDPDILLFENYSFSSSALSFKKNKHILKNVQKNKYVHFNKITPSPYLLAQSYQSKH